ncbi:MAG: 2-oxoacid:acceptor oxidoreductase family protein [Defluviitaleaceae bacterium]|nr:2-oxoacid:acceptor oxidoreductase family protein [Defluviitaleaceae bacterium]
MATTTKIIFSGFGGQGVLTLGQVVADIALSQGKEVTWMPSYGAEMRGGTANCSVIISDSVIGSPIILSNIDILCAMNQPSVTKFLEKTREGAKVFINSSIVTEPVTKDDAEIIAIDASNIAVKAGNARTANMVMMAGFLQKTGLFTIDELEEALTRRFTGKKELVDVNMKAIKEGLEALA